MHPCFKPKNKFLVFFFLISQKYKRPIRHCYELSAHSLQNHHAPYSYKIRIHFHDHGWFLLTSFHIYIQTSNGDVFEKSHDELDFEFLGNLEGKPWRFQTNLYGNGSTNRGREERYRLWFDPSKEFHRYSILWTANKTV